VARAPILKPGWAR